MNCADFKEQAAAFALGALEPSEREAMEAHLQEPIAHEGCAEALARAHESAAALARALPPSRVEPGLWAGIAAKVGAPQPAPAPRLRFPSWVPWAAAGVAAMLAVAFFLQSRGALQDRNVANRALAAMQTKLVEREDALAKARAGSQLEAARCQEAIAAVRSQHVLAREIAALMERPGTRVVPLGPANARHLGATAVVNLGMHRAFVMGGTLPQSDGHDYELWVIHGSGAPEPAGLLHDAGNGLMVGELDARLLVKTPDAIALSLEPAGGKATPTEVIALGKLGG